MYADDCVIVSPSSDMSSNTLLIVLPTDLRIVEQANSEVAIGCGGCFNLYCGGWRRPKINCGSTYLLKKMIVHTVWDGA